MNQKIIDKQNPEQKRRFDIILASTSLIGLKELNVTMSLIQTAYTFALEGINRVTATEISNRALNEYGIDTTASFTGQIFSKLGVVSVTSHGKNRFVLDNKQLEEIKISITTQIEERSAKLKEAFETYSYLPKRIDELEKHYREISQLRNRERELILAINEAERNLPNIRQLEVNLQKLQAQATRAETIKKECQLLSDKINKMPSLEEKKKALEVTITQYEKDEKVLSGREQEHLRKVESIAKKEAELANKTGKLQSRLGWLELAELQDAIKSAKEELAQIQRQLGEKRSLLDKLLLRNRQRE